jgi:hypothetical protein
MKLFFVAFRQFFLGVFHSLYIFIRLVKKTQSSAEDDFKRTKEEYQKDEYIERINANVRFFCFLNGAVFFSCVCYMDYIILPLFDWCVYKLLWTSLQWTLSYCVRAAFKIAILYFWSLSLFLFYSYYQLNKFGNQEERKWSIFTFAFRFFLSIFTKSLDIVTILVFQLILLIESLLMCLIPIEWLSNLLFHIHFSFFLAFIIFDIKWSLMGWNLEKRIEFIESRCLYFLGFGLVLSWLFSWPGSLIYNTTFSTFFIPMVVFNCMETKCEHLEPTLIRFPVFDFHVGFIRIFLSSWFKNKDTKSSIEKEFSCPKTN